MPTAYTFCNLYLTSKARQHNNLPVPGILRCSPPETCTKLRLPQQTNLSCTTIKKGVSSLEYLKNVRLGTSLLLLFQNTDQLNSFFFSKITASSKFCACHQYPLPSHRTDAGSYVQTTRPGMAPIPVPYGSCCGNTES